MQKSVGVIFGGKSAEHDVSIITAHIPIIESLLAKKEYDVWPIYITKEGAWYADQRMNDMSFFQNDGYEKLLEGSKKVRLDVNDGLQIVWPGLFPKKQRIDIVFPAMHGTFGEDGSLMGLLRMANVPFAGCDMFASAVAMDKVLTKQVVSAEGVPVVPYVWFTKYDWEKNADDFKLKIQGLSWPVFVKPVHLGSSIGITKAKTPAELENAIEVAFHYDDKVLVEESIEDLIEVTLPIMGNDALSFASIERPLNSTEFFDFNDKYLSGGKKTGGTAQRYSEIPAKIDPALSSKVKELAEKTFRILGCSGIVRIDFLIDAKTGTVYMNEVNTLPGTLYCHNWRKSGISNIELVTGLVKLAEERFASGQKLTRTFSSNVLQSIGGGKKFNAQYKT